MASEQINENRPEHRATTKPDGEAPWADLEVAIPNDRDHASIVALVECALVELNHEHVGGVVVTHQAWGTKRTQYVAVDDVGDQFQKRHFDGRLGWHETTVPRQTVRDELITQITRSGASPAEHTREAPASETNTFTVRPVRELQTP
ncbi:hypothetical protein HALDL1_00670 (plasmid) [Halobacterium sp. DL1]|jgi:hypothetical protein|uniref:hypothetical protein n=1 Tax=Halorubrum lacusprofundi TaxID=2247 RepID=UPI00022E66A7|nr:hypothetical protein [Halorubrum lacusprofundi]AHG05550.1 hypothetical protein HALDL1_00670 [Halobacterium sp. DL1]MCG1007501.1 hypothetical protein [Halorubrum lacusprofundi]